ncbi:MAG TPA: elongation factor 4 [Dehalococcoidia bacterium]|jgi:GTP-binding protein LepA|nr:elongation factor 4 [SAR202 cluster bacterium]HBJ32252.1 elongation factor 4 [Dehalococcoidia bacterium]|tara:strand:+ start:1606 stop:3450 length:1845 start_codon:yes stop_codon:yes gene_type:complete
MSSDHADDIRNFCIIAHIDHGKSTLADRLLQATNTVDARDMVEQVLDSMDLERERGITIKAQAVRMSYTAADGQVYQLNLIDTPGHVDFSYEVSRSLAACEGALLIVDATQGIQAQTLANVYLAMGHDLEIIPVVNKIDLDIAEPERVSLEVQQAFGFNADEVHMVSAKSGQGIDELLQSIVDRVPSPKGESDSPLRALIFDSKYDPYKGVVAYVRVLDGEVSSRGKIRVMSADKESEILEVGYFQPGPTKSTSLKRGEVGYVATGLKSVGDAPVGDTLTMAARPASEPLTGYETLKPMVFAGLYPADGEEYLALREALEKLQLNDAALTFTPESSLALGTGFRCGFLGLLHMDIVQERLEREYDVDLLATSPSVAYNILLTDGSEIEIESPAKLPQPQRIEDYREPWLDLSIITPAAYIGPIMELVQTRRGIFNKMEYLQYGNSIVGAGDGGDARVLLEYEVPLAEVLMDFYDQLKAKTSGYASMDYSFSGYRSGDLVKLDILVAGEPVDALSIMIHRSEAARQGRALVDKLKELIPRQMFEVPIQAAIGNRIIARENIRALRKNVLAKCYGGDVSRKRKLLEKQAEGKKRMKRVGTVEIPQEAFLSILKVER